MNHKKKFIQLFAFIPLIIFSFALGLAVETYISKVLNPNAWDFLGYFYSLVVAGAGVLAWLIFKVLNRESDGTAFNLASTFFLGAVFAVVIHISLEFYAASMPQKSIPSERICFTQEGEVPCS